VIAKSIMNVLTRILGQAFQISQARREMINAAKVLGFNPNVRENWYSITINDLTPFKVIILLLLIAVH
jgi:hypothetical protein